MAEDSDYRNSGSQRLYRVMCVATFEEAVHVLHCLQKKTRATGKQDKGMAEARHPCRGQREIGTEMRVSDAVNKKTAKFTIDTLVEMLSRVGKPVKLAIG